MFSWLAGFSFLYTLDEDGEMPEFVYQVTEHSHCSFLQFLKWLNPLGIDLRVKLCDYFS